MTGKRTAIYLRISKEDGEISQSIENQREFLLKYAYENNYEVFDIYADDGYSGTNFDRPEFRRMLRDIEAGKLDIVLTKDLSRLGRDYIGIGEYIEKYFPSKKIRYIAVNDHIDSGYGIDKMTPFMYVFNDFYPRDISDKVKAVLNHKKMSGEFIGSFAPYGYKKNPEAKGKLIVDETASVVVKSIFSDFLSGLNASEIALRLTQLGTPPPSKYSGRISARQKNECSWNASMIKRILTNPTYAGHITQNRSRKLGVKLKKQIILPPEQWITILNTHEPIIDQVDFDKVQELIKIKNRKYIKSGVHMLTGLVFCGGCGAPMTFQTDGDKRRYLICSKSRRSRSGDSCSSHCIREDFVEQTLYDALQKLCANLVSDADIDVIIAEYNQFDKASLKEINDIKSKINANKKVKYRLYNEHTAGILNKEDYDFFLSECDAEITGLKNKLERLLQQNNRTSDLKSLKDELKCIAKMTSCDRSALTWLVDRIIITDDKSVEIYFKFKNPA